MNKSDHLKRRYEQSKSDLHEIKDRLRIRSEILSYTTLTNTERDYDEYYALKRECETKERIYQDALRAWCETSQAVLDRFGELAHRELRMRYPINKDTKLQEIDYFNGDKLRILEPRYGGTFEIDMTHWVIAGEHYWIGFCDDWMDTLYIQKMQSRPPATTPPQESET